MKTPVPENYVFDSFALLAYLEDEAGATRIEALLEQARKETTQIWMSVVNLGEVLYIIERKQGLPQKFLFLLFGVVRCSRKPHVARLIVGNDSRITYNLR